MKILYYSIATGLGVGYSPVAPGTAGTILAALIAYFLFEENTVYLFVATVIFFIIGVAAGSFVEREQKSKDPSIVVVDEIVGMWISLLFVPHLWWSFLIAFALFRLFDVLKPFPANSIQNLKGGLGIMMDDVVAGIYALIGTHLLVSMLNYFQVQL